MHVRFLLIFGFLVSQPMSLGWANNSILVSADGPSEVLQSHPAQPASQPKDVAQLLKNNHIQTVDDYARWLGQNIKYVKISGHEEWESWQTTVLRGYGDCKNLSALNAEVLKNLGFNPRLIGYDMGSGGHLFTIFEKNGVFNIFDNTNLYATQLRSMEDVGSLLFQKHNIDSLFEINIESKSVQYLFTRARLAQLAQLN